MDRINLRPALSCLVLVPVFMAAADYLDDDVLSRIVRVDAAAGTCVIDRGSKDGLEPGSSGALYQERGETSSDIEMTFYLARGKVERIFPDSALIAVSDAKDTIKPGDCYVATCRVSEGVEDLPLYYLAEQGIVFLYLDSGQPVYTFGDLRRDAKGKSSDAVVDSLVAEIRRRSELAGSIHEDIITGGIFDGLTLSQAFERTGREEIGRFIDFVRYYPGKYLNRSWRFVDVYATWIINGTYSADEEKVKSQVNADLSRASALIKDGRYEDAMDELRKTLALKPDHETTKKYIEKLENIIRDQRIVNNDPENVSARLELGRAYYYFDLEKEALGQYSAILGLGYRDNDVYLNIGYAQTSLAGYDEAVKAFQAVLDRDPQNQTAKKWIAYASARKEMDKAGAVDAQFTLGQIKYEEGEYDQAISYYSKLWADNPKLTRARDLMEKAIQRRNAQQLIDWGLEHWRERDYADALDRFDQAFAVCRKIDDPDGQAEALENQGKLLKEIQDYSAAVKKFQTICDLKPSDPDPRVEISNIYSDLGRTDSAIAWAERAIASDSTSAWAQNVLGYLLYPLGRNQEAIEHLKRSARLDSTYKYPFYNLGMVYVRMAEYDSARHYFLKSTDADQDYADAHGRLANVWIVMECDSILVMKPKDPHSLFRKGRALYFLEIYDQAIGLLKEALKLDPGLSDAYKYLGYAYTRIKQFDAAAAAFKQVLDRDPADASLRNWLVWTEAKGRMAKDDRDPAAYYRLAETNVFDAEFEDAVVNLRRARELGCDSLAVEKLKARAELGLKGKSECANGDLWYNRGDYRQALGYYEKALPLYQAVPYSDGEIAVRSSIAWCRLGLYENEKAIPQFQRIDELLEQVADPSRKAQNTVNAGYYYWTAAGKTQKAAAMYETAFSIYQGLDDFEGQVWTLGQQAQLFCGDGDYARAESVYGRMLEVHQNLGYKKGEAQDYQSFASLYHSQDDYGRGLDYARRALALSQAIKYSWTEMSALKTIASIYQDLGDSTQALYYGREYLKSATAYASNWDRAVALSEIGLVYFDIVQDYRRAMAEFEKTLTISRSMNDRLIEGVARSNIGRCLANLGDFKPALEYQKKGLELVISARNRYTETQGYYELGRTYFSMDSLDLAFVNFQKGLAMSRSMSMPGREWENLFYLGRIFETRGRTDSAVSYYKQAARVLLGVRQKTGGEAQERSFMMVGDRQDVYKRLVELLIKSGKPGEAIQYLEESKSKMIQDVFGDLKLKVKDEGLNQDLARIEDKQKKKEALQKQLQEEQAKPPGEQNRIKIGNISTTLAKTEGEFNQLLFKIQTSNENLFNFITINPFSLGDVQEGLPEEAVLLEYFQTEDKLYIFMVQKGRKFRVEEVGVKSSEMEGLVDYYLGLIKNSSGALDDDFKECSRKLYDYLVRPMEDDIQSKDILIVVPFGLLYYLPFHALLRASEPAQYLIEWKKVAYLTSSTWLDIMKKAQTRKTESLFALGDPDGTLPGALSEVKVLKDSIFTKAKVYTLSEATKDRFLTDAKDYNIVHLATHGYLEPDPMKSYILMAGSDDKLTLLDIAGYTELRGQTYLVFLSACETAVEKGKSNGRELMSLAKAFTTAGPPSLIATLWKIPDVSTSMLVKTFYEGLKGKKGIADALREAQLSVIADPRYRHPYYWAGFLLFGDFR